MKILNLSDLEKFNGGYWKTLWEVGPGLYKRDTATGKYRWIQTQDNFSYTLGVIDNGWVSTLGNEHYFGGSKYAR